MEGCEIVVEPRTSVNLMGVNFSFTNLKRYKTMLEPGEDVTQIIHYDDVHPWTQEKGWDSMEIFASSEEHLTAAIDLAVSQDWLLYIRDNTGQIASFLYRRNRPRDNDL